MADIYKDGAFLNKNPTWFVEDSPWKAKQIIRIIERNSLNPSSICETGCGAGEILRQLSEQLDNKIQFDGYEISPQAYNLSKERANSNLAFYNNDLFDNEKVFYDIVMAIDVLEHVDDYLGFLRKLKTKGAYKIFHIPLEISVHNILRNFLTTSRKEFGHLHYFNKETALATLAYAGYEIIDYFYTLAQLELPSRSFMAKLFKLPRKLLFQMNKDFAVRVLGGVSLIVLAK
ncbi:MAG: class I SAM-dependent methyltransferase [Candidatus Anammoxibacter sp.]